MEVRVPGVLNIVLAVDCLLDEHAYTRKILTIQSSLTFWLNVEMIYEVYRRES